MARAEIFLIPGVKRLIVSCIPGRIAYGMLGLSTFFYVHEETGSVATAGLATGIESLIGSFTAGPRGHLIDRFGQTRPLSILVPLWVFVIFCMSFVHSTTGLLIVSGLIGLCSPPVNLSVRPLWRLAVGPDRLRNAYSVDTTIMNATFVLGPTLATWVSVHIGGKESLWITATLMALGGVLLISMPLSRSWVPEPRSGGSMQLWKHVPFVIMAIEGFIFGLGWGLLDISIPATATLNKNPTMSAWLLGILTGTSILAGLIVSVLKSSTTPLTAFRRASVLVALSTLPLAFVDFGWQLALVLAGLGFAIGFAQIYHMEVLEAVRPQGTATSAQAWLWTVEGSTLAIGVASGGWLVEKFSTELALSLVTVALCCSTAYILFFASSRLQSANRPLSDSEVAQAVSNFEHVIED
ncbi:MAG: MFS transporter [Actinobacteria bacterium]|nr:MFS transporter [Actinomycetota bacterium]NBY14979.1 MFS transporter [Actinomycetota bacterium]